MDIRALFRSLGGIAAVSAALEVPVSTSKHWPDRRSIPGKYWLPLLRLARERGVELTEEQLLHAHATTRKSTTVPSPAETTVG